LVLIEAMACGTPVIAYNEGAVPEIIEDGKTGFRRQEASGRPLGLPGTGPSYLHVNSAIRESLRFLFLVALFSVRAFLLHLSKRLCHVFELIPNIK